MVRHWPQLDGVRGLAIALVIGCHYRYRIPGGEALAWGWVGVDLFFVLSGFLCASILFAQEPSTAAVARFVGRRILRTWPVYFATMALFSVCSRVPWSYFVFAQSYLDPTAPGILTFSWSLAIEEHFYVALPIAWLLLGRRLAPVLVGLVVLSVVSRFVLLTHGEYRAAYALTNARCDALAVGCLLALYRERITRGSALFFLGAACQAVLVVELASLRTRAASPVLLYLGPLLGAVLPLIMALGFAGLVWLVLHDPRFARPFMPGWLRDLGRLSYGVYVYHCLVSWAGEHWFVPWLLERDVYSTSARMGSVCLEALFTVALVKLSWCWLEQPFLRLKDRI